MLLPCSSIAYNEVVLPCCDVLPRANPVTPEPDRYQSSLRHLNYLQLTGSSSSTLPHIIFFVPLQCLWDLSTILCRTNSTPSTIVLFRWHPPTAIIHIPPLNRTGCDTRLSPMDLQDIQRTLKQQANFRLPTPHAARITSVIHNHHQQHQARRATGSQLISSLVIQPVRRQYLLVGNGLYCQYPPNWRQEIR